MPRSQHNLDASRQQADEEFSPYSFQSCVIVSEEDEYNGAASSKTSEMLSEAEQLQIDEALARSLEDEEMDNTYDYDVQVIEDDEQGLPSERGQRLQAAEKRRLDNENRGKQPNKRISSAMYFQDPEPELAKSSPAPRQAFARPAPGSEQASFRPAPGSEQAFKRLSLQSTQAAAKASPAAARASAGGGAGGRASGEGGAGGRASDRPFNGIGRPYQSEAHPDPAHEMKVVSPSYVTRDVVTREHRVQTTLRIYKAEREMIAGDAKQIQNGVIVLPELTIYNNSPFLRLMCNIKGSDESGNALYTFIQIQQMDDASYNGKHDFIQIQFPIDRQSKFNKAAPLISIDDINFVERSDILSIRFKLAFARFLRSIGLKLNTEYGIVELDNKTRFDAKVKGDNHCLRRISRVIRSSVLFGFQDLASSLFRFLTRTYEAGNIDIEPDTMEHWYKAKYDIPRP